MSVAHRKPTLIRILLLVLLAGAAGGGLLLLRDERFRQAILDFVRWARAHQWEGAAALVLIYVAACVVLVPGSLLTLGAGFAFGLGVGFIAVYVGSNLGAAAAFLLVWPLSAQRPACSASARLRRAITTVPCPTISTGRVSSMSASRRPIAA